MIIPDFTKLHGPQFTEKHFKFHYPELRDYLNNTYPTAPTFQEKIYWYLHNLTDFPKCKCCDNIPKFINVNKGYAIYCSRKCMNSDPEKKEAVKKTNIKKYGGTSPMASAEVKSKAEATNLQRYGYRNSTQNPEVRERIFNTITKKYGGIGNASEKLKEKQKQTMVDKYGVEHSSQCPEIQEKTKKTVTKKYGVSNPCLLGQDKLKETKLKQSQEHYPDIIDIDGLEWICSCPHPECNKCKEKTYKTPKNIHRDRHNRGSELCTKLLPVSDASRCSTQELIIRSWLDEWGIEYETGNRTLIGPKELDIYIPSKNIAIECNGCYWHSDKEKPKDYHINKFLDCKNVGVQLLQIWEDWVVNKEEVVKSFLKAKLGICNNTIYARQCEIKEVSGPDSISFLNNNHIQGKTNCAVKLGLYYKDELVALMCFNKRSACSGAKQINDKEAELIRFCNKLDTRVIGAAGKLLKYFIKTYGPEKITSYSANDISNGQLYRTLGFVPNDTVSMAYWYVEPGTYRRMHRTLFTRAGICRTWPEYDIKDTSWTEKMVMDSKRYFRIYDSGTTRWEMILS